MIILQGTQNTLNIWFIRIVVSSRIAQFMKELRLVTDYRAVHKSDIIHSKAFCQAYMNLSANSD